MKFLEENNAVALCRFLDFKKADDILLLDLRGKSILSDFFIIVSARNTRHAKSLADDIIKEAYKIGIQMKSKEGHVSGEWILVDLKDIVIHIFTADARNHYSLERLWHDAKKVKLDIDS